MTDKNYFLLAAKRRTRFPSDRGDLTVEQLFQLPLTSLDATARAINTELKTLTEDSFIDLKPDPRRGLLADALETVKEVIADVQATQAKAARRQANAAERRALTDALAEKQAAGLSKASEATLRQRLAALDDGDDEA